jgi:autotransporter-associated beta strand protein
MVNMPHLRTALVVILGCFLSRFERASDELMAATVWTGPSITYTEPGMDPTLAADQDRITADVWITRASSQGIFNAEQETGFTHDLSPVDTEWADGSAVNWASLTFTDWNTWSKNLHGGPPNTVGVNAVMYLVSDDIYLNVTFLSWGEHMGGFSYSRSTPAAGPPTLVWSGTASGVWDVDTTANFSDGAFSNGDQVVFDSTGSHRAITIAAGGVAPGSIVFSNSSGVDYSLSGGPVTGATSLVVSGGGLLVLNNSNSYSGGTIVSSGILDLANANALAGGTNLIVGASAQTDFAVSASAFFNATGQLGPQVSLAAQAALSVDAATVPEPGTWALFGAAAMFASACRVVRRLGSNCGGTCPQKRLFLS